MIRRRAGDEPLDRLVAEHGPAVARYVRRRVRSDGADDVISEVLIVAWRRGEEVPVGQERAWLYAWRAA